MSELFVKQECEDINIYHTTANMNKLQIKEEGNIELSETYHYHNDDQNLNGELMLNYTLKKNLNSRMRSPYRVHLMSWQDI